MPVELNIVESVTALDTTVVEVNLVSASEPGPAGPGVPTGGTDGQVLTKTSATDYATAWEDPAGGGGGGAPADATYLVTTADGTLSAEVVVGATPGGELGGTWASPTVDATHSGSSHASVQAAAEATAAAALLAHTTDSDDAHDASAISIADAGGDFTATDVEGALAELQADHETDAAALTTHEADTTSIHGIADTSALALTANHPSNATFEDHSARHENGGADEISLAGLDGTPSALQTHLDDTAGAHAASAISADSTTLVGTGTDVQAVLEELDNGIADHIADATAAHAASAIAFAAFSTYTPTLTASSSNPTLGSGSSATGRYFRVGNMVLVMVQIAFGTSGTNAGSGTYRVSLPLAAHASGIRWGGTVLMFDASGASRVGICDVSAADDWVTFWIDSASAQATHAAPFAWAANDLIGFTVTYETDAA